METLIRNIEIEGENSSRKKMVNSRRSDVSNEEREEENNNSIASEEDGVIDCNENDRKTKKRKKMKKGKEIPKDDTEDHMKLFNDKEITVESKKPKVKEFEDVLLAENEAKARPRDGAIDCNEEREKVSNGGIAGEDAKARLRDGVVDGNENDREGKKRKKVNKGKEMPKDDTKDHSKESDGCADGNEVTEKESMDGIRKNKKDRMKVFNGKEITVDSKKPGDDTKAHNKGKNRKRKVKEIEDVVLAENEANCEVPKSRKRKRESSKLLTMESNRSPFDEGGLVQGKRFSNEEDELIKTAVDRNIEAKQLGDSGLDMILECRSHPEVKDCWQVISTALPWRPYCSVYQRARKLYMRGDSNWTTEEVEFVREFYKKHGPKWKMMADKLGKYHVQVRNAFQRYKLFDLNKGKWSQDEYRKLFELVNEDLAMKVSEEKKSKHGMLKDNIHWEAISDELGSRNKEKCCLKWYSQLTSPMVAKCEWADVDDYRMLTMLVDLDASCEEEVEWDDLLGHRSGELCRKRWLQMSRHLGEHGNKSFSEQVDVLSKRYCPDFAQVREALDARLVVD